MRENDLQVQNALDTLDERLNSFFKKCIQPNVKAEWKDEQFEKIKQEYYKTLENADEKVQLANHIYDLVDRHLRKLDQELSKFKMELEADNAGITEVLEKRSLEMDKPPVQNHRAEKRKLPLTTPSSQSEKRLTTEKVLSTLANEIARDSFGGGIKKTQSASSSPNISMFNSVPSAAPLSYKLGQMGAGSNAAIAAAASQAIAATQHLMQSQGRRTPSMKASYVAMAKGQSDIATKDIIGEKYYSSQPSTPTITPDTSTAQRSQRTKKQTSKAAALFQQQQAQQAAQQAHQQAQQQKQQQQSAVMSALPQLTLPTDTQPSQDYSSNELQIVDEIGRAHV